MKSHLLGAAALTLALAAPQAAAAQTLQEGSGQWNLVMINAEAANRRGYTGEGVVIGVLDSGVDTTVADLAPNMSGISFDVLTGADVTDDPNGHGTHVAGIIAASRNGSGVQGVAYDASLAPYRLVDTPSFPFDDQKTGETLFAAVAQGVRFFNNSWGWDFYLGDIPPAEVVRDLGGQIAGYRAVAAADGIMIFSTGNEYKLQPNLQAGMPFYVPELREHWLAVTAVGPTGAVASYANHCGLAAAWCLAAPGGEITTGDFADQILSTGANGGLGGSGLDIKAGTSMAAPHVTGAVAIAAQMYPNARAADLSRLILVTATDIGDPGVDSVYGWGLLNLGNVAVTRDAQAASVFANGVWSAADGQSQVIDAIAARATPGVLRTGWITVAGRNGAHEATPDSPAAESDALAIVGGFDVINSGDRLLGLALAHSQTDFGETGLDNSGEVTATTLAAYGGLRRGGLFIEGAAGAEVRDYRFRRGDILGTSGTVLEETLTGRAETGGDGAFATLRAGAAFGASAVTLRPYAHARTARQQIDAVTERGADVFGLSSEAQSFTRHEAGPGIAIAFAPQAMGRVVVAADLDLRHSVVGGDDDLAFQATALGSTVPGRIGDLGDVTALQGGVVVGFGDGFEASLRGVWAEGERADAAGLSASLRLTF